METRLPVTWYPEDMPRLRMVVEKNPESKPITIRPVDLRQFEPQPERAGLRSPRLKRAALLVACLLLAPVLVYFLVDRLVVTKVQLPPANGAASQLEERRYLWRYSLAAPQRGDRVVTSDHSHLAVKRVIARPSDWLKLKDGVVYLNGKRLDERLIPDGQARLIQLGENQYYVIGERRDGSDTAPGLSLVYRKNILGRLTD